MAYTRLPLPDYPWTSVFRALVDVIEQDPDLRRVVKVVRSWKGGPEDLEPLGDAQLPWIEMTPAPSGNKMATESDYQADFRVNVKLAVPGTRVDDLMNLWGAVMQAVRFDKPFRDVTVGTHLRNSGATVHTVVAVGIDPKMGVKPGPDGKPIPSGNFQSDAALVIPMFVPS